jgi:hypothetical protein
MLECLEWLTVEEKMEVCGMVYLYKAENRLLPEYMFEKLVKIQDIHGYETRSGEHGIYLDLSNKKLMY